MSKTYLLLLMTLVVLSSCKDNNKTEPQMPNRTVLVYMGANNNLYNNALDDINEMEQGWNESFDGKLVVYLNPRDKSIPARLYQIQKGTTSNIDSKVLKEYGVNQDDCDPQVMAQVISDAQRLAQAKSYGVIFWSHATGWIPGNMPPMKSTTLQTDQTVTYSFGHNETYKSWMEIYHMANAMPQGLVFDFIAFDACHMASIESTYQLRKHAKYIIASAAETPAQGFKYNIILEDMFAAQADLVSFVNHTFEYYSSLSGWEKTCTLSLTDCSKLEQLAATLKNLITTSQITNQPNYSNIQQFGRYATGLQDVIFDLDDFISKCWTGSATLPQFRAALSQAIVLKVNTPIILQQISIKTYCGATTYIPQRDKAEALHIYRTKFNWSKDSGLDKLEF